jgi:hypothetical protein
VIQGLQLMGGGLHEQADFVSFDFEDVDFGDVDLNDEDNYSS